MSIFSDRTSWELSPNRFTSLLEKIRASGSPIYDLTVSNPTQCGFQYCQDRLLSPLMNPANVIYQADPHGLVGARRIVAEYYAGYGIDVPVDHIFLTASTSEAYGFLFRLLANPHDHVVFPKPSYPLFEFLSGIHDLDWQTYHLVYRGRWLLDRETFQEVLGERVKAVILVNPNNPTGSCLSPDEERFVIRETCCRHVPIICDEVFLDYRFGNSPLTSWAGQRENLTFVLGGLSKSLALPQMKCSWIVVSGPQEIVAGAVARLEVIADTYLSVNTPVQHALGEWMGFRSDIPGQILERVCHNRAFLADAVKHQGGRVELLSADGGWSAVVHCPKVMDEEIFVLDLLENDYVCIHPGYFFDFLETGYYVLSLLPPEEVFQEGVRRMLKRLGRITDECHSF